MAKRNQLGYRDIESRLEQLKHRRVEAHEVGYHLLYAFGKSEKDISRHKEGKGVLKPFDGLLIKGLLCYKAASTVALTATLEGLKTDPQVAKAAPKIICVSDGVTILAYDRRENDSYENPLGRLYCDFAFFYPLADVERVHNVEESPADVKAAEQLAKLHDELRAYNEFSTDSDLHDLNIFISRLLFCFFAEDTGIFEANLFSNSIKQYTKADGSDLADYLREAFHIMDVQPQDRGNDVADIIRQFPYVNGGLFALDIQIPRMSPKARKIIIACGDLDWQDINPDIFGSMIQAVVNPDVRANQGMHYTSVPNIMKVINPLFLDELRAEYNRLLELLKQKKQLLDVGGLTETQYLKECKPIERGCNALLLRMSKMKFFDPACGSGNFLIITYKMLRLLEMDILQLIRLCHPRESMLQFIDGSCISISQFYGIELLDFPHEIAMLSLWLAEHQMNKKLHEGFGVNTQALPLQNITQIRCGNACRLDWNVVCPHTKDEEVFVFGNPPYLGSRRQDDSQKKDMELLFHENYGELDYIACWFKAGADYIRGGKAKYAFVTTNSICQGLQVALLWKRVLKGGLAIDFAYTSFKWANNAKHNAAVTVIIVGVANEKHIVTRRIFTKDAVKVVKNISP
ncbi:MAG: class I SAM-dependent DNA methyltransferase, partial [Bacteroidales bacterium]|nr:class I SAM-dependent DNA methyltransferase [Bacteroidales bacterium]